MNEKFMSLKKQKLILKNFEIFKIFHCQSS